jgi:CubicO group peptidase (beta-lactamase class C family)
MFDQRLDRRDLLRGTAMLGAAALVPTPLRARDPDWVPVRQLLEGYITSGRLPGLAAAVGRGDGEAWFLSAGRLARDSRASVGPDTLYRVYSMTKPITGIAAMLLVEDGRLALDQDVSELLPAFARPRVLVDPAKSLDSRPAARPITVRHLLTHTAGLGYTIVTRGPLLAEYQRLGLTPFAISRRKLPGVPDAPTALSLAAFAERLATLPLIADPGTRWSYSVSLDLLGRVIEVASGMPFDRFLATRIFAPLGMTSSFFRVPESERSRLVTNYFRLPAGELPVDTGADSIFADPPAFPFGGAGLVMSPRDYDRFLQMLAGEGAIGKLRVMTTETARLAMSNLLPPGVATQGTLIAGQSFGAGGRVTLAGSPRGSGAGTFGWGGAAATIAFVDRARGVRASGFAQFMPDDSLPFPREFATAVYRSL